MSNTQLGSLAIIGGTGLDSIAEFNPIKTHQNDTRYGAPSDAIAEGNLFDHPIFFLPRHGSSHKFAPHLINYRANICALKELGVTDVLSITAVGGISREAHPCRLVIPDQIIDYTYGRAQTYFDGIDNPLRHIDFTDPFTESLRQQLIDSSKNANLNMLEQSVYGVTQGPRLETAAEIRRMANDGCDIVGMTVMPEAALARELELNFVNCSMVVNWAAGLNYKADHKSGDGTSNNTISMDEIERNVAQAVTDLSALLESWLN